MKRTLEYKLLHALAVARANPEARILYACGTRNGAREAWMTLVNLPGKPHGFRFNVITRTATHEDGGVLMVRDIESSDYNGICGIQVTHAWVDEWCNAADVRYVSSRVRAPQAVLDKLKEPMGVYGDYFVTRTEQY